MDRIRLLGTAVVVAALLAPVSSRAVDPPDRELIEMSASDAESGGSEDLPPTVARACAYAGLTAGSAEHHRCGEELVAILKAPRGRSAGPRARLVPGFNLGAACSRYYPAESRRAGEQGSVVLLVFVAPDHRVHEVIRLEGTGFQRLDEATARCMYKEGRFQPALVDTRPVGSWQKLRYTWRL